MRVLTCAFSAVLLSGCSWMGYGGNQGPKQAVNSGYGVQYAQAGYGAAGRSGPCQSSSPAQSIPRGCRPEQVTLALAGQNQHQRAQYAKAQNGQYTTGAYGSQLNRTNRSEAKSSVEPKLKKPWLRGTLGLEIDHSISGVMYEPGISAGIAGYDRALHTEGFSEGSVAGGQVTETEYTSVAERVISPQISFDDVYTAPLKVSGGLEFILGKHATVYANAGYVRAEGKKGGGTQIIDELRKTVTVTDYDATGTVLGSTANIEFVPNETVATFTHSFNEYERIDLEAGGRYYFNPILQDTLERAVTPFISASGGASHIGETTVSVTQRQRFLQRAFENNETDFYDVNIGGPQQIYDAQWVPYGTVKGGIEWQVTPKTALAFEAGLKYQGARDFSDGTQGEENISIPFGIRGSYNF